MLTRTHADDSASPRAGRSRVPLTFAMTDTTESSDHAASRFFSACTNGDVVAIGELLDQHADLVHRRGDNGITGLHLAVRHPAALRLLLERGADPNVRETDDNALPLHGAAGHGDIESVRLLLDAGSDVQGSGDRHTMDTIGWATCFADARRDVVELLLSRGARHHVFSAIALGDREALRRVVAADPVAMHRRLSRYEQHQSALHYVVAPADGLVGGTFRTGDHYATLDLLIELGAEVDARDAKGRTPLGMAMLRGDGEAMRRLHAAGATIPDVTPAGAPAVDVGSAVQQLSPMIAVPDVNATVAWYVAIGFTLMGCNESDGRMDWACVSSGGQEVMLVLSGELRGREAATGVSLWFRTDRLDDLYAMFRQRAMEQAHSELTGSSRNGPPIRFAGDLYTAFHGQREFSLRDPNGIDICFYQPLE